MNRRSHFAHGLVLAATVAALSACPSEGRSSRSDCALNLPGAGGLAWLSAGIQHYLDTPSHCPIPLTGANWVYYSATATIPNQSLNDVALNTIVYNYNGDVLNPNGEPVQTLWQWYDSFTREADVSFQYVAGTGTPTAGEFTDYADNLTSTSYGEAEGTALLTYRKGAIAAMQGPVAPTPGTNVTWNVSVSNAAGPFTYRWFKDGAELSGQTASSLTLGVSSQFFALKTIATSPADGADTLEINVVPGWQITINGMTDRSPNLMCGFDADAGTNPSSYFEYRWTLDGVALPDNGSSANPKFTLGSHTLELAMTDQNGYTAQTSVSVNVRSDGPSNCM
jgi:hypothetical protein